jgi:hypothetical protein
MPSASRNGSNPSARWAASLSATRRVTDRTPSSIVGVGSEDLPPAVAKVFSGQHSLRWLVSLGENRYVGARGSQSADPARVQAGSFPMNSHKPGELRHLDVSHRSYRRGRFDSSECRTDCGLMPRGSGTAGSLGSCNGRGSDSRDRAPLSGSASRRHSGQILQGGRSCPHLVCS